MAWLKSANIDFLNVAFVRELQERGIRLGDLRPYARWIPSRFSPYQRTETRKRLKNNTRVIPANVAAKDSRSTSALVFGELSHLRAPWSSTSRDVGARDDIKHGSARPAFVSNERPICRIMSIFMMIGRFVLHFCPLVFERSKSLRSFVVTIILLPYNNTKAKFSSVSSGRIKNEIIQMIAFSTVTSRVCP